MMIFLFGVLNDEQRALVERIFHEHRVHFQRISFKIVKSEEAAEDVVSTAFVKIMDNIEKISELPCPQMTAFCVTISSVRRGNGIQRDRRATEHFRGCR